jgi:hypothetical protein
MSDAPEEELYGLPLEEFTPARDRTAKEIRKAGDKETAARIAKLPKPTPAAWAANQLARSQPELIDALLDAGAALRAAQDAAISGGGAAALREATLAERHAVDDVMAAAVSLKPGGKALSRAMADRLRTTLRAAAGDPQLRGALASGRLVGEAAAGGAWPFALDSGGEMPAAPKPKPKAKTKAPKPSEEELAAERAAEAARKALETELREARGTLRVRERVATGAEEDAEEAVGNLASAREALQQAKQALEEAEAEAESARRVLEEARASRDEARDTVARLEERLD